MKHDDTKLGMNCSITRRDVIAGAAVMSGAALMGATVGLPSDAIAQMTPGTPDTPGYYPPALTGMRGSHPGSFEAAHLIRDGQVLNAAQDTGEHYDAVIVGAGMSGLAAAYFYRKKIAHARILILDNHDDFGGHARRNEFQVGDRKVIGYGGTQYIDHPESYTVEGRELMRDIGIRGEAFRNSATPWDETSLAHKFGLQSGVLFDRETYGVDRLVLGEPSSADVAAWKKFVAQTPLSAAARRDLVRLHTESKDYLSGLSRDEKARRLHSISYTEYLVKVAGLDPQVAEYLRSRHHGYLNGAAGYDTVSAWTAFEVGVPGFSGLGLDRPAPRDWVQDRSAGDWHFPDGNHGFARLIVRSLIPDALPGSTQEDSITKRVDYSKLDRKTNDVRIRLSSTVGRVTHLGTPERSSGVAVVYLNGGKPYRVQADCVVLACNNSFIPYIAPEVPEHQKQALHNAVRMPLVYGTVCLRNWRAFAKVGVGNIVCPGTGFWWDCWWVDYATSIGDYQAPQSPDDPMPLSLSKVPSKPGLPARDQFRIGRAELLATDFETIERATRRMLTVALGPGGFDAARDIVGITVNRHPHGYANCRNELYDPDWAPEERPWVVGRKRVGRIAIANSDAGAICLTQAAIDQAHRAVTELVSDVIQPMQEAPWGIEI